MSSTRRPIRVAIIGGGCAAMTAAHELTRAEQGGRFEVTVYQQGWRLGGKGASGRGPCGRIEEHGLHVWMGCYENAFRLMRSVYGELDRDPRTHPIPDWRHAFMPASHIGLASWDADADWTVWSTTFPPLPGEPGAPLAAGADNPFSLWGYVVRMAEVMRALFETVVTTTPAWSRLVVEAAPRSMQGLMARAEALARTALGSIDTAAGLLRNQLLVLAAMLRSSTPAPIEPIVTRLAEAVLRAIDIVRPAASDDPNRQRAGEVLEITAGALVGIFRSGVLLHPRGFDMLDELDFIDWLRQSGVSEQAANSPFMRGLYSLMFAYEGGDYTRPRQAAGQALRGCLRMFFSYRGSFFWKMQAGMGDIVFAPLYELLRRRGVRFELFHRLADVHLGRDESGALGYVAGLELLVQAEVLGGRPYEPLVSIHGLPCWPSEPDWSQLVDGDALRRSGVEFESHWEGRHVRRRSLRVGEDFDFVVLGVSVGAIPHVCRELLEHDERWRVMCAELATVATQSLQLWTHAPLPELGWRRGPVTMTAFTSPFDTWSDMTHLVPAEAWPAGVVGSIAYFCNVLDERDVTRCGPEDAEHPRRVQRLVREHARAFVERDLARLWPAWGTGGMACGGLVDWTQIRALEGSEPVDPLDAQFYVGNVNPSDRYVQCLPGTTKHRISPLDRTYDNLTIAGDWTDCGLNLGCVESAVMSGLLASHALSGLPRLEDVIGYDHP